MIPHEPNPQSGALPIKLPTQRTRLDMNQVHSPSSEAHYICATGPKLISDRCAGVAPASGHISDLSHFKNVYNELHSQYAFRSATRSY